MNKKIVSAISIFGVILVVLIVAGLMVNKPAQQNAGSSDGPAVAVDSNAAATFYEGKVIKFLIPYSPGGGYDEYVRMMAPYMEESTGARIDVQNLPGAGGMRGVNELYSAPNTGLVIGILNGSALITSAMAGIKGAEYELDKFEYLGRVVADPRVLVLTNQSGYKSFDEFLNPAEPIKIGATGLGGSTYVDAVIAKEAFNLDYEIIHGFDSSPIIRQSMLRGNIVGTWGSWGSAEEGVKSGLEFVLLQSGQKRLAALPDVPTVFEYADKTADPARTRAILTAWDALIAVGRSIAAPPGTSADKVKFLRDVFYKALHDPRLLAKSEETGRLFDYATGEDMTRLTMAATQMPADIEELFIKAINGQL
ncbi:MAG: Bug family tripartite tricarboxylate transporter substrate binding protein [Gammaproteobacteria bacterium]|jgi:tripartite-type tricarboxylate transporter receptor subunit TctC